MKVKIIYTKHAKRKFKTHRAGGWNFSNKDIIEAIKKPYFLEINKEKKVKMVLKKWDENHDLRVIYKEENDIMTVITFYPTEKSRYVK